MEQVEFAADLAVVAALGLFQHVQIGFLLFLGRPGGAVNALEHLVLAVAAPVGASHLHQLEDLQLARGRHVGAAAEVDEIAFAVQAEGFVRRDRGDDLGLVLFADALEEFDGVVARPLLARDGFVLLGQFGHFLFDGGQVFGRERALVREVVVEAVIDHRADGYLGVRKQLLDGIGQQVGRRVADQVQAVGVLGGHDRQTRIAFDAEAGVDQPGFRAFKRDAPAQGGLGQARADRLRHFGDRYRPRELALRTIGQCDLYHREYFLGGSWN
ncbi:hypothetical protein FQZ97_565130 [compost metagenome]